MYGFDKGKNGLWYGAFDNVLSEEEYQELVSVIEKLPKSQQGEKSFEVFFAIGDYLVTDGDVNRDTGRAKLFGYSVSSKEWQERAVDLNVPLCKDDIRYGNMLIDENGVILGISKKIGGEK